MKLDQHKTLELGRRLLDRHGLTDWRLHIVDLSHASLFSPDGILDSGKGHCDSARRVIYLDYRLKQRAALQTILHEIAHALVPEDNGHGERWQSKALEIGCTWSHVRGCRRSS
jgi:hypothetical protein